MVLLAASPDDPVKVYYDSVEKLHLKVRKNAPFTYLAYKSMLPAKEDDFIYLAYKISYFVTFKFFLHIAIHMASPLCTLIPYVPFVLDGLWVSYQWACDRKEERSPLTTLFYLSVSVLALHYLDKFPDY